jgi:PAS domain S-box-containing protein
LRRSGPPPADTENVTATTSERLAEEARLAALHEYRILDTPREQAFDDLVELAAVVCQTAVAAIGFFDETRLWLKASFGTTFSELPRDAAIAAASIASGDAFVVRDVRAERRLRGSLLARQGFRFFAGVPLVSPDGHVLGTVCVLDPRPRDLTAEQQTGLRAIARQALGQLELRRVAHAESAVRQQFRALVEQLPGGVYIENLGAGSGWYFSPHIERVTSYSAEEWASEPDFFARVLHPEDRDRVLQAFARVHETHETIQVEYRIVAKDGRIVWVQDDASVAFDEEGKPLYLQGVMTDVTARNEREAKFRATAAERDRLLEREREQNERLRSVDRLKDEFIALVSHELRTPLTSIRGYLELVLEEGADLRDDHLGFLEIVDRNAERLLGLVNDLLAVAQAEAGKLRFDWADVELEPLLAQCVEAARPAAERAGVRLTFSFDQAEPIVADPGRVGQLVDNLVSNAIKFTPAGGCVDVRLRSRCDCVVIEVEDTGPGIASDEQARLFERFFRTRSATNGAVPGTGLGLSIAKAIAEAHGGTIAVESEEGRGTTFRVELPAGRVELSAIG